MSSKPILKYYSDNNKEYPVELVELLFDAKRIDNLILVLFILTLIFGMRIHSPV
jgi:hypothetical protein